MDNFYYMLKKIRDKPGLVLEKKSLDALSHFWNGYAWGSAVEAWEISTNRSFFDNYEEATRFSRNIKSVCSWDTCDFERRDGGQTFQRGLDIIKKAAAVCPA